MAMWGQMLGRGSQSQQYDQGIHLFDQGMYEQAIEAFQYTLSEPKNGSGGALIERLAKFYLAESHSALALAQMSHGATDRAIENLQAAILLSPNYADLHYHLGCAYLSCGMPGEAVRPFCRALEINPGYARALLYLGITRILLSDYETGLKNADDAAALDPTLRREHLEAAREVLQTGHCSAREEAAALLRRMGETETDDAFFHARLALDLFRRGMLDEAVEQYRQALALKPEYADLRNHLGVALYALRRDEEAAAQFAHALRINPRYLEARMNYGLTQERLGNLAEARQTFESILESEPEHIAAHERLRALGRESSVSAAH
jgi:tetratricopeptide (TPR) repeat protein